jgi:hypothetical protein
MRQAFIRFLVFLAILLWNFPGGILAQDARSYAIIPAFHDRVNSSGIESPIRLTSQRFIIFVYRNAVAVYSEARLVNTGYDSLTSELSLPSTGHRDNGPGSDGDVSNGILSVRMWVEGARVSPEVVQSGNADWYTIPVRFAPGIQRTVKAMFWAETSITDVDSLPGLDTIPIPPGPRGFTVDLSHASVWNDVIHSVNIAVVLKGGLAFDKDTVSALPETYERQDSVVSWEFRDLEPGPADNPVVRYSPNGPWPRGTNTMARLSAYIVTKVYDELVYFAERQEQQ